jgi:hypothetical protein
MTVREMLDRINHANNRGLLPLVKTVNAIEDSLNKEPFPIEVLLRLGEIVRQRLADGTMEDRFLAPFLKLHHGYLKQGFRQVELFKAVALAITNHCFRHRGNMSDELLVGVSQNLCPFQFRDDRLLNATAFNLLNPSGGHVVWVETIGSFLHAAATAGYASTKDYERLRNRAIDTAKSYQSEVGVHNALTKIAWSHLIFSPEAALETLGQMEKWIIPAALDWESLVRLHQIYFANKKKKPAKKFAQLIRDAEKEREEDKHNPYPYSSTFEDEVLPVLQHIKDSGLIEFKPSHKLAFYRVDFLVDTGSEEIVIECDHPIFHQFVKLQTKEKVKSGEDVIRDNVISGAHRVIRITTTDWNAATNKVDFLFGLLFP